MTCKFKLSPGLRAEHLHRFVFAKLSTKIFLHEKSILRHKAFVLYQKYPNLIVLLVRKMKAFYHRDYFQKHKLRHQENKRWYVNHYQLIYARIATYPPLTQCSLMVLKKKLTSQILRCSRTLALYKATIVWSCANPMVQIICPHFCFGSLASQLRTPCRL